jgi:hypothetical protein
MDKKQQAKRTRFPYVASPKAAAILAKLPPRAKTAYIDAAIIAAGGTTEEKARAILTAALLTVKE